MHDVESSYRDGEASFTSDRTSYLSIVYDRSGPASSGNEDNRALVISAVVVIAVMVVEGVVYAVRNRRI